MPNPIRWSLITFPEHRKGRLVLYRLQERLRRLRPSFVHVVVNFQGLCGTRARPSDVITKRYDTNLIFARNFFGSNSNSHALPLIFVFFQFLMTCGHDKTDATLRDLITGHFGVSRVVFFW